MGISIESIGPERVRVTLECDVREAMFCHGVTDFEHNDGFVGCHITAMHKGWLERQTSNGRIFLCPECSGKPPG